MKNKFLVYSIGILLSMISFAQYSIAQDQSTGANPKEKTLEEKMEGTYLVINNSKFTPVFTTDFLLEIEKRRDDTKEIYYEYSQYVTIKILPRSVINAAGFNPQK